MTMDFADAMRAALNLTRDHKLVEATRVIQKRIVGRGVVSIQVSERSGDH
jgi:hypothetical protein